MTMAGANAFAANFLRNQSFEIGEGAFEVDKAIVNTSSSALYWTNGTDHLRSQDRAYSGSWSIKSISAGDSSYTISNLIYVETSTQYKLSGWIFNSLSSGNAYIDLAGVAGQPVLMSANGNNAWEYIEGVWNSGTSSEVQARCASDGNPSGSVWFDDIKFERAPCFVTTSGYDFYNNGRKWYPYGINYWPRNCVSMMYGPWLDSSGHYDAAEIEKDLMAMSRMGMNMVYIAAGTPLDEIAPNLLNFLQLCDKYCIKVNLAISNLNPMFPNLDPNLSLDFIRKYNLKDIDALFAYDISWEPTFGSADGFAYPGPNPRGLWDSEWRDWVIERYGSISAAESALGALNTVSGNQFGGGVVRHNVPARMVAGQNYSVLIEMKNIGTGTWSQANGYRLTRMSFYPGSGYVSSMGPSEVYLEPADSIATGGSKTFSFDITAPSTPGRYLVAYKMFTTNYSIQYFWGWVGGTCRRWVDVVSAGAPIQEMTTYEKVITGPTDAEAMSSGSSAKVAAYRHFVDELLSRNYGFIIRQIKEIAPDQLVSFRQNSYGRDQYAMSFDFKATCVWNDFVQPEAYTAYNGDTTTWRRTGFDTVYARFASANKRPVWWAEGGYNVFSYSGNPPPVGAFNYEWGQYKKWWIALKEAYACGVAPWWFPGGWRAKDRPGYEENSDFGIVSETCVLRKVCAVIIEDSITLTTPRDYTNPNSYITIDRDSHADGYLGIYNQRSMDYVNARDAGNTPSIRTTGTGTNSKNTPLERIGNIGSGPPKYLKSEFVFVKIKDAYNNWAEAHDGEVVDVPYNSPIYVTAKMVNIGEAEWCTYSSAPAGENGSVRFAGNENAGNVNFRQELDQEVPYLSRIDVPGFPFTSGITSESTVVFQMVAEQRSWFGDQVKVRLHPVSDQASSTNTFTNSFLRIAEPGVPADGTSKCTVSVILLTETGVPRLGKSVTLKTTGYSSYDNITQPAVTDANGMCTGFIFTSYTGASDIYAEVSGETNIYQNLVSNPSFESGFSGWQQNNSVLDPSVYYSGVSSARLCAEPGLETGCLSDTIPVDNSSVVVYRISLFCRVVINTPAFCVTAFYYREDGSACGPAYENIIEIGNTDTWRKRSALIGGSGSGAYFILPADCLGVSIGARWAGLSGPSTAAGTGWIDCVRMERVPSVTWTATGFAFSTSPVTATKGNPSPQIFVEARGSAGSIIDSSFTDTCDLSSSSAGGKFSVSAENWVDTTVLSFSSGSASFYYKDLNEGFPSITVSRQRFASASQAENILAPFADPYVSNLKVSKTDPVADGTDSAAVIVTVNDSFNFPITGKQVFFFTDRPDSDTIKDSAGNVVASQVTDKNGQCTAYISSLFSGELSVCGVCDGATITENVVPNPSFEDGTGANASLWARDDAGNFARTTEKSHSGNYSLRLRTTWGKAITTKYITVSPDSVYRISAWMYNSLGGSYNQYVDLNDVSNDISLNSTRGANAWEYKETTWSSGIYTQVYMRAVLGDMLSPAGTCWFDDIRMARIPTLTFIGVAIRIKIVSAPFTVSKVNPATVTVEAWDSLGARSTAYNDPVSLSTSSASGSFSLDKNSWSSPLSISMIEGQAVFYYKDTLAGVPVITVTSGSLAPDSQSETVTEVIVGSNSSRLFAFPAQAKANGAEQIRVVAAMNDVYGFPVPSQPVTLCRTDTRTIVPANPLTTDANGMCTFTVTSSYAGIVSLSALCADGTAAYMFYDDFLSYAEGSDASQAWIKDRGAWKVQAGEFVQTPAADGLVFAGDFKWTDYTIEARMRTDIPGAQTWDVGRIFFRCAPYSASYEYYFILLHTYGLIEYGVSRPSKPTAGNEGWYSNRKTVSTGESSSAWHKFRINVTGSGPVKIDVYMDDVLRFTQIESEDTFILTAGKIALQAANSVSRFDDVKVYPCSVEFTGYRTSLTTDPFRKPANAVSPQLTIAVCGALGGADVSCNTNVVLTTTSSSGGFSAGTGGPWTNTRAFSLVSGRATCYYRDLAIGNPAITVLPNAGSWLLAGTQIETITAGIISIPYFSIRTSETSSLITALAVGDGGETNTDFSEAMAISSSSSAGRFSVSGTSWKDTTAIKFESSAAYFCYRDKKAGSPVITIYNTDLGLSSARSIDVLIPDIRISVSVRKEGSGATGVLIVIENGDTLEYEISAYNAGNETAALVTITDTFLFDTGSFFPLAFVSMETFPPADSWSYKNTAGNWQAWGIAPASGDDIKGLRWGISTLGVGETRVVRFRVRVK